MTGGCIRKCIWTKSREKTRQMTIWRVIFIVQCMQRRQSIQLLIEWGKEQNDVCSFCNRFLFASFVTKIENVLSTSITLIWRKERQAKMQQTSQSDNHKRWIETKKPEEGVLKHWNWTLHTHQMHTTHYQRKRNRTRYIYTLIFSCVHTAHAHAYTLASHTFKSSSSEQYKQGSTVETFDGAYFFHSLFRNSCFFVGLITHRLPISFKYIYVRRLLTTDDSRRCVCFSLLSLRETIEKCKPIIKQYMCH